MVRFHGCLYSGPMSKMWRHEVHSKIWSNIKSKTKVLLSEFFLWYKHIYHQLRKQRMAARNQKPDYWNDLKWFWHTRYWTSFKYQHRNSYVGNKKKETLLQSINHKILEQYTSPPSVQILKIEEVEADEMWSFVGKKKTNAGCGMRLTMKRESCWLMS